MLYAGIALFALAVIFALITLPVEFNASRRALAALEAGGYLQPGEENAGREKVLSAAAMTYVASAFMAIMQLLRLLAIAGSRRDDLTRGLPMAPGAPKRLAKREWRGGSTAFKKGLQPKC